MKENKSVLKFVYTLMALAFALTIAAEGQAKLIATPFGHIDDSCVHLIPLGGEIDAQTGDVSLNGASVGHHDRCSIPTGGFRVESHSSDPSTTGRSAAVLPGAPVNDTWYAWTTAHAVTISGMQLFNDFSASFNVPSAPLDQDSAFYYLFPSLETQASAHNTIIQTVLSWGANPYFGGHQWELASWEVYGCDGAWLNCAGVGISPPIGVNVGDAVGGEMFQTSHSASIDGWEIYSYDNSNVGWTYNTMTLPASWPKFVTVQMGVFEAYNLAAHSCLELPASNSTRFNLNWLYEGGPNWNSSNLATSGPYAVTFAPHVLAGAEPACLWGASTFSSTTTLTWSNSHTP